MKELGAYLKRTRVSNGVNIAEAAEDLELTVTELENIESGNVKAFKDLYDLKENIRFYAKYLGLDSEKVVDEYNSFLFDHTSKLSLDDIKAAQKKIEEDENKIKSPYTKEYKNKSYFLPASIIFILFIIVVFVVIYFVITIKHRVPERVNELSGVRGGIVYELTY